MPRANAARPRRKAEALKVLFVENVPGFGGSLTGMLHLVEAFPLEIEPILLCPFDPTKFVDVPQRLRVEIARVDVARTNRRPTDGFARALWRFSWRNCRPWMREVVRVGREHKVDLIHANNLLLGNFGAALAGWRLGCPVISHQKGYEHKSRLVRKIIDGGWYAHHIATSQSIADHLRELGVAEQRCTMIYDAIIPPSPMPRRRCNPDELVVAMHSVLRPSKGHEVFLRAVRMVADATPRRFRAVIAGDPPQASQYPDDLKRLARELGIADRVEFPGHIRDVFEFLAGVDVSVHASLEPEPFGRVAAESMIVGTPVIAAAGSGAAEYVERSGGGWTTPPGDAAALADAIVSLLEADDARASLGGRGREFALVEFAPERIAGQVVSVYQEVLARPAAGSNPKGTRSYSHVGR